MINQGIPNPRMLSQGYELIKRKRVRPKKKVTFSEVFNVQSRQLTNCHKSNGFEPCTD